MPCKPPQLPIENIEAIIAQVWSSPLSVDERIDFMTKSMLVSKAWMREFIFVSSRDVHIPCPSYADQFLRILSESSAIYDERMKPLPNTLCRSITFHLRLALAPPVSQPEVHRVASSLSSTLHAIQSLEYLPNLRHVIIDHVDFPLDDLFEQCRLLNFPRQVRRLDISYAFERTPIWLADGIRSSHQRSDCVAWYLPSIRQLSIAGACDGLVMDMFSACPRLDLLETDSQVSLGSPEWKIQDPPKAGQNSLIEYVRVVEDGES